MAISGKRHEEECDGLPMVSLPAILDGDPDDDPTSATNVD
jgi:hypothetical protein